MANLTGKGYFKKGQSGNPKGKAKGTISVISKIKNILQEVAKTTDGKKRERLETLARNIVNMAINKRDKDMIKMIVNYIDGMPKQRIGGDGDNPMKIEFVEIKRNAEGKSFKG